MKAYLSRNRDGTVASGWLLRGDISIHSTMCRLRRTQPNDALIENAAIETVIRGASRRDPVGNRDATSVARIGDEGDSPVITVGADPKVD